MRLNMIAEIDWTKNQIANAIAQLLQQILFLLFLHYLTFITAAEMQNLIFVIKYFNFNFKNAI